MTDPSSAPYPSVTSDNIGWLTRSQMVEVDRLMIEEFRIELIQMMENAGRSLAQLALDLYQPTTVSVLAGSGGNGGGGLVAARHLANHGVNVTVTLGKPAETIGGVPGHQLEIIKRMGIPLLEKPRRCEVTIDALVGYSLQGPPRGRIAELISRLQAERGVGQRGVVVSLDTPTGLDVTDGSVPGVVVRADATLTLALPKVGLRDASEVGALFVADISVPPEIFQRVNASPAPTFGPRSIIEVTPRQKTTTIDSTQ